jgi:Raf kinase inhibitor-like YbhB/YbcL family protein
MVDPGSAWVPRGRAAFAAAALMCVMGSDPVSAADAQAGFVLKPVDTNLVTGMPLAYTLNAYGCTGGNTSPALEWSGAPEGTQSYVLTLFDPDERSTPSGWWHWAVYDLPKDSHGVAKGAGAEHSKTLPKGARHGRTDLGNLAYHGPCPDKGDPAHRYVFTLYALKVAKLPVKPGAPAAMVVSTAQESVLGKAVFEAHYAR